MQACKPKTFVHVGFKTGLFREVPEMGCGRDLGCSYKTWENDVGKDISPGIPTDRFQK